MKMTMKRVKFDSVLLGAGQQWPAPFRVSDIVIVAVVGQMVRRRLTNILSALRAAASRLSPSFAC